MNNKRVDLKQVAAAALNMSHTLVPEWLPDGKREGAEWVALNPQRHDTKAGSFKVNLNTGVWIDFACDGVKGADLLDLYHFVFGYANVIDAAKALAARMGVQALEAAPMVQAKPEDDWENVRPVPAGAPEMHKAHVKRGHPEMVSEYKDADDNILGAVMRFRTTNGGKDDIPHTFWRNKKTGQMEWKWRQWSGLRPLYGLDALAAKPDAAVLIVEGEKCKNAVDASEFAGKYATVTWSGGAKAVEKTDWSAIRGRHVCLWPDADSQRETLSKAELAEGMDPTDKPYLLADLQPGMKAMKQIAAKLMAQGCVVYMVNIPMPGIWPDGFDIADALADPSFICVKSYLENAWYIDPEKERVPLPLDPITVVDDVEGDVAPMVVAVEQGDARGDADHESRFAEYSAELMKNYWLVDGKTKAINIKSGLEFSRQALNARFSKEAVESWFNNPRKNIATPAEVAELKRGAEKRLAEKRPESIENLQRYTYLDGSLNVWDAQLSMIIPTSAAKEAMGENYKDWQNSASRRVIPMSNVVFEPGLDMGPDYINLFQGLPYSYTHPVPKSELPTDWLQLIPYFPECLNIITLIDHLCNGDKVVVRWLLNWMAYPLQNVGAKMGTAVLMHSDVHGSGKSVLWEKIIKPLYGRNCAATAGQHDMESQYTGGRSGKLFMLFEEILASKDKYGAAGAVKQMVTGETHQIHKKFLDAYEEANRMNCVFLSNFIQPLPLEEHDRRFLVIWPKETTPDDLKNAVLTEINEGGLQAFFNYLMALPLTIQVSATDGVAYGDDMLSDDERKRHPPKEVRFDAHTWPVSNKAKQQIIEWGLSGWQLFHRQWKHGDLGVMYASCAVDDVWRFYQTWCSRNNEKAMPRNKFVIAIGTKIPKARRWVRCNQSNDKTPYQAQTYKVGLEPAGMTEQDFLGDTVIKFKKQVDEFIEDKVYAL